MRLRVLSGCCGLLAALGYSNLSVASNAAMELFVDVHTKQIYAEDGPDRVSMGRFVPEQAAATQAESAAVSVRVPVERLDRVEARLQRQEQVIESVAAHPRLRRDSSPWTPRFHARGYVQNRYTSMLAGDEGINLWSDRSVGDDRSLGDADKNFLIRRARLILAGDIGEHFSFYLQPDFASSAGDTGNIGQLRDFYGDIYLDPSRVHRLRIGQSKVPYGFENMQSSSNRLAGDRVDALNSAVRDERDTGLFYYYTPQHVQQRFDEIASLGLKHSGNYGMFGFGFYNGQGANRQDRNDNQHTVARVSYPWKLASGQFFEAGLQAYTGSYVPSVGAYRGPDGLVMAGQIPDAQRKGFDDERVAVSAMWYPQPWGLQAEWNWGRTPGLDAATGVIDEVSLRGGYVQAMYMHDTPRGIFLPFIKWQYFDGANKAERNAPSNKVNDWELGLEWQIRPELELTAVYHRMHRNNLVTGNRAGRVDYERFRADALRLQLQFNY